MKQIHLAAHFPGVNNTTVWSDPTSGSQTDFSSFVHLAQTAERGKFDFFFLAEGLRLREHRGRIFDLDVVGRPDSLTVLAALAAVTDRIGLAATLNTTFNEPYELARQFATLDHLSNGRAAWNAVTSPDAFTGENFRRGGFLARDDRYERAAEFIEAARQLWDSWATTPSCRRTRSRTDGDRSSTSRATFDRRRAARRATRCRSRPATPTAGASSRPKHADVIFSRHSGFADGQAFYADVKGRLARYGRRPDDLKIIPAATAVLGDTEADAEELAAHIRTQQVSPQGAIAFLEQVWGRDLSAYDPDGPLPDVDPDVEGGISITRGRVRHEKDPLAVAAKWRAIAEAKNLSIRELIIEMTTRTSFVGSASTVADQINELRAGRRGRRLHPRAPPHAARPRRVRRRGRPAAPGARRVPRRLRRPDAPRPPRADRVRARG